MVTSTSFIYCKDYEGFRFYDILEDSWDLPSKRKLGIHADLPSP